MFKMTTTRAPRPRAKPTYSSLEASSRHSGCRPVRCLRCACTACLWGCRNHTCNASWLPRIAPAAPATCCRLQQSLVDLEKKSFTFNHNQKSSVEFEKKFIHCHLTAIITHVGCRVCSNKYNKAATRITEF